MKIRLLIVSLILTSGSLHAAGVLPEIKSVYGKIEHGEPVLISGNWLTPGPSKAGIRDDFESGHVHPAWFSEFDFSIHRVLQRHPYSKFNARADLTDGSLEARFRPGTAVSDRWFVQYWFYLDGNWTWGTTDVGGDRRFLSDVAVFRLWNPLGAGEDFSVHLLGWKNTGVIRMGNADSGREIEFLPDFQKKLAKKQWHLFQFEFRENSEPDLSDGEFTVWLDGRRVFHSRHLKTRFFPGPVRRPYVVGFSSEWEPNRERGEKIIGRNEIFLDDVYVDSTLARVELGDEPYYDQCSIREIQPVVRWNENQIEIKANTANFPSKRPVFLFVIKADGLRTDPGFPVSIGKVKEAYAFGADAEELKPSALVLKKRQPAPLKFPEKVFQYFIYDDEGNELVNRAKKDDANLSWDGKNRNGRFLPAGRYLFKIQGVNGLTIFEKVRVEP